MSSEVPQLDSALSGVQIGSLSGFRGQEAWGRWTLGKVSQVNISANQPIWVEARLKLELPMTQQTAAISLNGENLTQIKNSLGSTTYEFKLALQLKTGNNVLSLLTNKSNLDPLSQPFAPKDPSDIAISITTFNLTSVQPFTDQSAGRIYNTLDLNTSSTYIAAAGQQVKFLTHLTGRQILNYRLLSARDQQVFEIRLDGQRLLQTPAQRRGTLITGQLPLQLKDRLQAVTIAASDDKASEKVTHDSIGNLEYYNGSFPFYIQELRMTAPQPWQVWQLPVSIVGVLISLSLLALWLLRRGRATVSGQRP